jgi:hypothetical protein
MRSPHQTECHRQVRICSSSHQIGVAAVAAQAKLDTAATILAITSVEPKDTEMLKTLSSLPGGSANRQAHRRGLPLWKEVALRAYGWIPRRITEPAEHLRRAGAVPLYRAYRQLPARRALTRRLMLPGSISRFPFDMLEHLPNFVPKGDGVPSVTGRDG